MMGNMVQHCQKTDWTLLRRLANNMQTSRKPPLTPILMFLNHVQSNFEIPVKLIPHTITVFLVSWSTLLVLM